MHESFLVYERFRYLKLVLWLSLAAIIAYVWHDPPVRPNGGTWLGYTLGGVGAFFILVLLWLGVRKRRYYSNFGTVRGWTSAHVYLGLSLLIITTLHTGFQFGWNVHTLAYTLMVLVIASGIFGIITYERYPALMTTNRSNLTQNAMLAEIDGLDRECLTLADQIDHDIHDNVLYAINHITIGGSTWQQVSGKADMRAHDDAMDTLRDRLSKTTDAKQAGTLRGLIEFMRRKGELVRRLQRDIQLKALMEIWLYIHVPLSFALLATLLAHVTSVFFYW